MVETHILQWIVPWLGRRGLELALLPAAGAGCPGASTMHPMGFIYKQLEAGTGQPGISGTRRPIMLIITT